MRKPILLSLLFSLSSYGQSVEQRAACPPLRLNEQVLVAGISDALNQKYKAVIFAKTLESKKAEKRETKTTLMIETFPGTNKTPRWIQQVPRKQIARTEDCLLGFCTQDRVRYKNVVSRIVAVNRCDRTFWVLDENSPNLSISNSSELSLTEPNPYFNKQYRQNTRL